MVFFFFLEERRRQGQILFKDLRHKDRRVPYLIGTTFSYEIQAPNHQRWYAKWKLRWNAYASHTRFCTFGADLHAQSVPINEISASDLSRKFIATALLAGHIYPS